MASALKGLLAAMHSPAPEITVLPKVETFFMHEALSGRREDDGYWHPSVICGGVCPRMEVIKKIRPDLIPEDSPITGGLLRIFWLGTAIHDLYQNKVFGPMGILWGFWKRPIGLVNGKVQYEVREGFMPGPEWRYEEMSLVNDEYRVTGHTDGVLYLGNEAPKADTFGELLSKYGAHLALLELKSANDRTCSNLIEARQTHIDQSHWYMWGFKVPTTIVFYVNKNTSVEREFVIKYDASRLAPTLAALKTTMAGLKTTSLPARLTECSRANSAKASKCLACGVCMTLGFGQHGYREMESFSQLTPTV